METPNTAGDVSAVPPPHPFLEIPFHMPPLWYRFAALPRQWPGRQRPAGWKPTPSKFKGHAWGRVEREIRNELAHLRAKDVVFMLDLVGPGNIRDDGALRADARPATPRVVLQFTRGDSGVRLTFPCDTYSSWEDNLWAIRLSLEALRSVDRHGVTQGDQQYVGFAALPPATKQGMTLDEAIVILQMNADAETVDLLTAPAWMLDAIVKRARATTHPDAGGSDGRFQEVETATTLVTDARAEGA